MCWASIIEVLFHCSSPSNTYIHKTSLYVTQFYRYVSTSNSQIMFVNNIKITILFCKFYVISYFSNIKFFNLNIKRTPYTFIIMLECTNIYVDQMHTLQVLRRNWHYMHGRRFKRCFVEDKRRGN